MKKQSESEGKSVLNELPLFLARFSLAYQRLMNQHLSPEVGIKLHPSSVAVIFALDEGHNYIIQDLVNRLGIPNGTLTGVLQNLESLGYLSRIKSPTDGRAYRVELTKKGKGLIAPLKKRYREFRDRIQVSLKSAEATELCRLLGKLQCSLEEGEPHGC